MDRKIEPRGPLGALRWPQMMRPCALARSGAAGRSTLDHATRMNAERFVEYRDARAVPYLAKGSDAPPKMVAARRRYAAVPDVDKPSHHRQLGGRQRTAGHPGGQSARKPLLAAGAALPPPTALSG